MSDKFSYGHIGLEFALGKSNKPQLARHNAPAQLSRELTSKTDALTASLAAAEDRYRQRQAEVDGLNGDIAKLKADTDGDGVSDYFDKCPGTPAGTKVDGSGCALPEPPPPPVKDTVVQQTYIITEEDRRIVNEAIRNLEFDFAKSSIRPRSYPSLNRVAQLLVKKNISLKLAGHTDNIGSESANMKLSKDRAESVKNYLVSQGANPSRIEAVGYGETQPIATNKTAAGRQKNRRVEFTIY
jgi:OOP family OmpA-OmpF porin